jgi:ferrochelatase
MSRYKGETATTGEAGECLGVLLVNLGTPDAPTPAALRRYLAEFLADPRVVETPRLLWLPVLHGVILRTRPRRSAQAYERVWTEDGSPLLAIGWRQQAALQKRLDARLPGPARVELAMRYGRPSIADGLERLRQADARRVLVLPLYPQYSATTTASVFDAVSAELQRWRRIPELRFVNQYHDEEGYIGALAAQVRSSWEAFGRAERLLFSFHGIPRHYADAGDPYAGHCQETARLTAERLGLEDGEWALAFQSRFGPRQWLKPYTDQTLREWARKGVKRVEVICPGFAADCLETLDEIGHEYRERFLDAGGEAYRYIPALNDTPEHMEALADLVLRHVHGWPEARAASAG